MCRTEEPLSVGFVLLHRFTLLPFAAFVDCLRLAADVGDRSRQVRCHWTFMSSASESVLSSSGAAISPCERFRDPAEFDYLVVVGGVLKFRGYDICARLPGSRMTAWDMARLSGIGAGVPGEILRNPGCRRR
ncbi:hypothetical protein [Halomonas sp. H10-9-1]|uniref:hypothetical protein n=1 Tax=Halomonas sp. H10-9-1 TaxID=2950871 RepID=UPI0032E0546F